jgi:hypothetical protein
MGADADVAQLVERDLAKVEVAGSSPVVRSREFKHPGPMGRDVCFSSRVLDSNLQSSQY